jgi:hypothetical protein
VAQLWELSDRPCGKLLAPLLPMLVAALERHGELRLAPAVRVPLMALSPATLDRLLRPVRHRLGRQPRRPQPPGTTLKGQIPLRTFGEWQDVRPGALQGDVVLHCGESTAGFYLATLVGVDVATGWSELEALWGLGHRRVGTGLNFFRPIRKLMTKRRVGSKVHKRYDAGQTPYHRLLAAGVLSVPQRQALEREFVALNPAMLAREIDQTLEALWKLRERDETRQQAQRG